MSLLGKILVVVQTILALLFLGVQGTLYHHQEDWRSAYEQTTERQVKIVTAKDKSIGDLEGDKQELQRELQNARQSVELHRVQVENFDQKVKDQAREYSKQRGDFERLQANHDTIVGTIREKDSQISDYLARIAQLEDVLKDTNSNMELAQAQVARLLAQRTALEKDLVEVRTDYTKTKQKVLDYELVVEELNRAGVPVQTILGNFPPAPPLRGAVAGVDTSVQPSLVLLTIGEQDGVKRGYQFTVYRDNTFVGKVVVTRLMADSVGCRVLFTAPGETIQAGDQAATQLD